MTTTLSLDDLEPVKAKQQATSSSGNDSAIGTSLQIVGENLCEAVDVVAGSRVLDVAAGNGNVALAAARPSPQAFFDTFRTYFGPVLRAWEALDADGRASFERDLVELAAGANRSEVALTVPADYLEIVVTKA